MEDVARSGALSGGYGRARSADLVPAYSRSPVASSFLVVCGEVVFFFPFDGPPRLCFFFLSCPFFICSLLSFGRPVSFRSSAVRWCCSVDGALVACVPACLLACLPACLRVVTGIIFCGGIRVCKGAQEITF